jgi:hypothetical protein
MCKHQKVKMNKVYVCVKCGLMVDDKGYFIGFDKKIHNYIEKRNKRK